LAGAGFSVSLLAAFPFISGACECPAPAAPKKEQKSYRYYEENGQCQP
jgi:hypothetical protein